MSTRSMNDAPGVISHSQDVPGRVGYPITINSYPGHTPPPQGHAERLISPAEAALTEVELNVTNGFDYLRRERARLENDRRRMRLLVITLAVANVALMIGLVWMKLHA